MKITSLACVAVLAMTAVGATHAQAYKWRDQNGGIVYSDTPPPGNIPPGNILQSPKLKQAAPPPAAEGDKDAGKSATAKAAPKSIAEREADYKKRQMEEQKKAKEQGEKTAQEEQRQAQCDALKQNLTALEAGQRMAKVDSKGERYFIDDAERAKDISKAKQDMATAKCSG